MAFVGYLSIFLSVNHFHQQIGELALLIAGCDNSKRLIYLYNISINLLKIELNGTLK